MLYFTNFIILHRNMPQPDVESICPFIWNSVDFDSDGDFYFENLDGYWNDLSLKCREKGKEGDFRVYCYREKEGALFGTLEQHQLKLYIENYRNKTYGIFDHIAQDDQLAVSVIEFSTRHSSVYNEFLENVYNYVIYTKGIVLNSGLQNAGEFREKFILNEL